MCSLMTWSDTSREHIGLEGYFVSLKEADSQENHTM